MNKELKKNLIAQYAKTENDTGSMELQVALLTHRINELTQHFQHHRKDYGSKQGLLKLVSRRKKYLHYLEENDIHSYKAIIDRLGLRK